MGELLFVAIRGCQEVIKREQPAKDEPGFSVEEAKPQDVCVDEAHEHVELSGRARRLENALEHHAYPTIATWVEKHNRYAIWEAAECERFLRSPIPQSIGSVQQLKRRLKKIAWRLPMRALVRFIYAYILRLGFLDGKPGLIFCGLLAFYDFLASANRYEQQLANGHPSRRFRLGPLAIKQRTLPRPEEHFINQGG